MGISVCSNCNSRTSTSYFRITKVTAVTEIPLTLVCSLRCLTIWCYKYAQMNGMMLAVKAKNTVTQFIDGLRNLKG